MRGPSFEATRRVSKKLAGVLALMPNQEQSEESLVAIGDQWQIHFARFLDCHPISSTNPDLIPLHRSSGTRRSTVKWISSSSPALLKLFQDSSISDVILAVYLRGEIILEEHYLSKLHFSWPQVSCLSGFPARGTRAIFVSYRDSTSQIQKFALRFSTSNEAESFINILKEMLKHVRDVEPISSDFESQIPSQSLSEFVSSNRPSYRSCEELSVSPAHAYQPQIPVILDKEVEASSCSKEKTISHHSEDVLASFPPSFTSLLTSNCSKVEQAAAEPHVVEDIDLRSQIAKYMEDSTFIEMLNRVEKVIDELGGPRYI